MLVKGALAPPREAPAAHDAEQIAERLIEHVRDLHVELAVQESGSADPILDQLESLVMQVEAEAEVDAVGKETSTTSEEDEEARRRAAKARQAQRES